MRARVYLRIAPTARGFKFAATGRPSSTPLMNGIEALPTLAFAIDLRLPTGAFEIPVLADVEVPVAALHPTIPVEVVR